MKISSGILTRESQINSILEAISRILPESIGAYLYGSAVLSELHPDSDLDFLILSANNLPGNFSGCPDALIRTKDPSNSAS